MCFPCEMGCRALGDSSSVFGLKKATYLLVAYIQIDSNSIGAARRCLLVKVVMCFFLYMRYGIFI